MKSENEGPFAYEDFLRHEGCPTILRCDNSKMQTGDTFTNICRTFGIGDGFTEPHHPHQNPAENHAVRWIKQHTQLVMNITGAPEYVWPDCVEWLVSCHNVTAHESLNYRTPYEKRHGTTPDISAFVLFHFWEKIYYHAPDNSFPDSKELPGYFLGVANNVGDALTFIILSEDGKRLHRSVIRSALGKPLSGFPNSRLQHVSHPCPSLPVIPMDNGGVLILILLILRNLRMILHNLRMIPLFSLLIFLFLVNWFLSLNLMIVMTMRTWNLFQIWFLLSCLNQAKSQILR